MGRTVECTHLSVSREGLCTRAVCPRHRSGHCIPSVPPSRLLEAPAKPEDVAGLVLLGTASESQPNCKEKPVEQSHGDTAFQISSLGPMGQGSEVIQGPPRDF